MLIHILQSNEERAVIVLRVVRDPLDRLAKLLLSFK